ncbi:hypothetical protein [Faecalicatena contorta]|uniref:hypothetical protein n=1 Tax=Faecalicatena contorta TaxID=39482 RepID=UPI001FAF4E82|nr:hypothetical protein [Faecalicatena contorta]
MQMDRTDTEKRRRALLAQTRSLYSEKSFSPAVHPRYRNAYNSLYGDGEDRENSGLFGLRVILCCLLFIGFVMMDNYDITVADVSSSQITEAVEEGVDVRTVWQEIQSLTGQEEAP